MIKANELRIGNWVRRKGKPISILGETEENCSRQVNPVMIRDCDYYKDNWSFESIPLTPEILEKCGFEKVSTQTIWNVYEKGRYRIEGMALKNTYSFRLKVNPNESYDLSKPKLQYLHQLQNLIFALNGEELELKELQS